MPKRGRDWDDRLGNLLGLDEGTARRIDERNWREHGRQRAILRWLRARVPAESLQARLYTRFLRNREGYSSAEQRRFLMHFLPFAVVWETPRYMRMPSGYNHTVDMNTY